MKEERLLDGQVSRRGLLIGAGKLAAGAAGIAVVATGGLNLLSKAEAKETPLPWPYEKLDPNEVADLAYNEWYRLYCGAAVISSIFTPLKKKIGEPYASFPVESFIWMHGGVVGWGTMCGTETGAALAANLIAGQGVFKDGEKITNEVIQWYSDTDLPVYVPKTPKITAEIPKSKSGSPLCHVSVGKWMKVADKGFWSPERKDRCARLTANVAAQTVKLLNDWKDGKFKSDLKLPAMAYNITAQHNCTECHGDKVPVVNAKGNPAK